MTNPDNLAAWRSGVQLHHLGVFAEETLAVVLGVGTQTLATWRGKGEGPVYSKAGKAVYYRVEDVVEWFRRCRVDPRDDSQTQLGLTPDPQP